MIDRIQIKEKELYGEKNINNDIKTLLISNIDKIHTTSLGIERINKNLDINIIDIVSYLKEKIIKEESKVYKKGKNLYCLIDNMIITINSYNYCIITVHKRKKGGKICIK